MAQEIAVRLDQPPPPVAERLLRLISYALVRDDGSLVWIRDKPDHISAEDAEAMAHLAQEYRSRAVPARPEMIVTVLTRLDAVMPSRSLDVEMQTQRFLMYAEDLADVPLDSLLAASKKWRTNAANKWFPTPGELLAMCETASVRRRKADTFDAIAATASPRMEAAE